MNNRPRKLLAIATALAVLPCFAAAKVYSPELFPIPYDIAEDGEVAMVIENEKGERIRNLVAQVERVKGRNQEKWDCRDGQGIYVSPGKYRWRGIYAPPLELHYQQTVYPNVEAHADDRLPWNWSPKDGFLGNHTNLAAVCALGDKIYMSMGGTEGGHAFLEANLKGQKLWGTGAGADHIFTDGENLYVDSQNVIYRIDLSTHRRTPIHRKGSEGVAGVTWVGWAAHDNRIYVVWRKQASMIKNAFGPDKVDLDHCYPTLPVMRKTKEFYGIPAYHQREFLRLCRLYGKPPGMIAPEGLTQIRSTKGPASKQYVVLAFKEEVGFGTLLLPSQENPEHEMMLSLLKPGAPYPPEPGKEDYWEPMPPATGTPGWLSVTLPEGVKTRALRIAFKKDSTDLDDVLASKSLVDDVKDLDIDFALGSVGEKKPGASELLEEGVGRAETWTGKIDGLRMLKNRFKNLVAEAKIWVNSGEVDPSTGVWDAKRDKVVTPSNPGVYLMTWEQSQKIRGLAFKEIGGARTEIDVYRGPPGKPVDPEGVEGWEHVSTYRQPIRNGAHNAGNNARAKYLDGTLDFGREIDTRAMRLRVIEPQTAGGTADVRVENPAKRCKLYGIAVLQALDEDIPDATGHVLEVRDATNGELVRRVDTPLDRRIAFSPDGKLCGISKGKVVRVDPETGEVLGEVAPGMKQAFCLTFDDKGNLYVFDNETERRNIRVYDPKGKFLRTIGTPGLREPGIWDPAKLVECVSIAVDRLGQVWAVYPHENPRRIVQYNPDGSFAREFLGNTHYGGGGTLDRYDKTRAYYKTMDFFVDWKDRRSRVFAELHDQWLHSSIWWPYHFRNDVTAAMVDGRRYLVTQQLLINPMRRAGFVYLVDEKKRSMRLVAGAGMCTAGDFFRTPEWTERLEGKQLSKIKFMWSDFNGDEIPQPDEVKLSDLTGGSHQVGRFNLDLSLISNSGHYQVKSFTDKGVPIYEEVKGPGGVVRLTDGNYFQMGYGSDPGKSVNRVVTPEGEVLWTYPAWNGVSGLWIADWSPGYVSNQLVVSGHEKAHAGELGEFFVIGANTGQMNLWSSDGFLAGRVTYHTRDPKRRTLGDSNKRGTRMDRLTLRQEHFHSFFTKTEEDGRYYIIGGDDLVSIIEVRGIDKYRRISGEFEVTLEDIEKARSHYSRTLQETLAEKAPVQDCPLSPLKIDGAFETDELLVTKIDRNHQAQFRCSYDKKNLYLSFMVNASGPFRNGGDDYRRIFKTGAGVEIRIGTDPKANPRRKQPTHGDLRLVLAFDGETPKAVLYRPRISGGPGKLSWKVSTVAGGETRFDEVRQLTNLTLVRGKAGEANVIEAAVPLNELGLQPSHKSKYKFDWGFLSTDNGLVTSGRNYWTNRAAVGVTDEPIEARLNPSIWGTLLFGETPKQPGDSLAKEPATLDDLLDQAIKIQ